MDELLEKAEEADTQAVEEGSSLPQELADRAKRRARLEAARMALDQRGSGAGEAVEKSNDSKRWPRAAKGPIVQRRTPGHNERINTTDTQSVLQPTAREGFIQGYNAQAAVSVQSGLIVAAHVVTDTGDRRQLAPTVAAIPSSLGVPEAIVVDTGYDNTAQILRVERTTGAKVYCAPQKVVASAAGGGPGAEATGARSRRCCASA